MHEAATTIRCIPDYETHGELTSSLTKFLSRAESYPFDLASDLGEVREWSEQNVAAVDALLARHADLGAWNLPEERSRFAY
jgi:hypothetical protein